MEIVHIFRKIIRNGVEIKVKRKNFQINYDSRLWDKFPVSLRKLFADSLAYIVTWHLPMVENVKVVYHFSHPPIEPSFFKMLLYSIPMTIFENKETKTSEILKKFYNVNFETQFKALNSIYSGKKTKKILKEKAVLLFSFGKDSLLTYALLKELTVSPVPIFMQEPQSIFENAHKKKLSEKFYQAFNEEIDFFPLSIGKLRQENGLSWGWDIILSQYAFLLLPYFFYYQAKYMFFGNEQSCNFYTKDSENYLVNPVFEQSVPAMQLLQDIPKMFFIQTHIGSLVEPVHEIFITYILHHRYPKMGAFQMSCLAEANEAQKHRWCGNCEKCARMYIYFKALGIDPKTVGFKNNNMLAGFKRNLYVIFDGNTDSIYGGSGLGKDEQLLAFYIAYKKGVTGELIEEFKEKYLKDVEKKKDKLIAEYFSINSSLSLPPALRKKTLKIFTKERESVLNYLNFIINSNQF